MAQSDDSQLYASLIPKSYTLSLLVEKRYSHGRKYSNQGNLTNVEGAKVPRPFSSPVESQSREVL